MIMEFSSENFASGSLNTEPIETPMGNAALSHCDSSVQNTLFYLDTVAIKLHSCANTKKKPRFNKTGYFYFVLRALYMEQHNRVLISTHLCVRMFHKQINIRDLKEIVYI